MNIKWFIWSLAHSLIRLLIRLLIRSFTGSLGSSLALPPSFPIHYTHTHLRIHLYIIPVRLLYYFIDSHIDLDRHNKNGNFASFTCTGIQTHESRTYTHARHLVCWAYFKTRYRFFHFAYIDIFSGWLVKWLMYKCAFCMRRTDVYAMLKIYQIF